MATKTYHTCSVCNRTQNQDLPEDVMVVFWKDSPVKICNDCVNDAQDAIATTYRKKNKSYLKLV